MSYLLYCKDGVVKAWHDPDQIDLPQPSAYGDDVYIVPWDAPVETLPKYGPPPDPPQASGDFRPYAAPGPTIPILQAYAANVRWRKVTGGFTSGGLTIRTDDASRNAIAQIKQGFDSGALTGDVQFKAASGWVEVDEPTVTALYAALVIYIQDCYAQEAEAAAAIAANSATTFEAVDAFFA